MFRSQGSDLVKGAMLVFAIEAILDFAGEQCGQFRMIECEASSHDAYGTPRALFFAFFQIMPRPCARYSVRIGHRRSIEHGKNCWATSKL